MKAPFRLDKVTTILVTVLLGGILAAGATKCQAAEPELHAEIGHSVIRGPASSIRLSVEWPDAGPQDADFECGLTLIAEYEYKGAQPNQAAFDCLLVDGFKRFDLGIGPAYLQNTDTITGSHFNFALMARYRFTDRLMLAWRHWSNAGTIRPNAGRDVVFFGYSF